MEEQHHTQTAPTGKRGPEITLAAILLGLILSVVMGAANVYLGLRAGMTVSASIPAAVVAMGILRGLLRRNSILESNLVQTSASAGESLAAGIIFTMPALIMIGVWEHFDFWVTTLIALGGGLLGVLMMIPMRKVFVVDDPELKFPEGVACAAVLKAGHGADDAEESSASSGVALVFAGIALGAIFKFLQSFLAAISSVVEWAAVRSARVFYLGIDISPALVSVGYIVGLPIAVQIFIGGSIGWLIGIPLMGTAGLESEAPIEMAFELWQTKVRYMGVGAMVVGGIVSIWRVRNGLVSAVKETLSLFGSSVSRGPVDITERNLGSLTIISFATLCVALIVGLYYHLLEETVGLTVLATISMIVMSFFFSAVASYIVGLVGNSNSPVSGMTITAVLATGALIYVVQQTGWVTFTSTAAMVATLGVAGIVCCVACTSGDVCNDLKTGHLIGASPRSQQIMQILGVGVAAFVMAPVMTVLHEGGEGIGSRELPAPQAGLFKSLAEGFFGQGELPRDMVAWGIGIGIGLLLLDLGLRAAGSTFRLHVMPVAVGIYLPFGLAPAILLGGLLHFIVKRRTASSGPDAERRGILLASGAIAGESLVGVLVGFLRYMEISNTETAIQVISLLALLGVVAYIYVSSVRRR